MNVLDFEFIIWICLFFLLVMNSFCWVLFNERLCGIKNVLRVGLIRKYKKCMSENIFFVLGV